jgi:hypothetical protein
VCRRQAVHSVSVPRLLLDGIVRNLSTRLDRIVRNLSTQPACLSAESSDRGRFCEGRRSACVARLPVGEVWAGSCPDAVSPLLCAPLCEILREVYRQPCRAGTDMAPTWHRMSPTWHRFSSVLGSPVGRDACCVPSVGTPAVWLLAGIWASLRNRVSRPLRSCAGGVDPCEPCRASCRRFCRVRWRS